MPITINGTGTVTGISAGGLPDGVITTDDIAANAVTQAKRSEQLTASSGQTAPLGANVDFTGIPSWVKRVTVVFNQVSTSGTSHYLIQIGSGSISTTNYGSTGVNLSPPSSVGMVSSTAGFLLIAGASSVVMSGHFVLTPAPGSINGWIGSGVMGRTDSGVANLTGGQSPNLSGALDRVRVTTVNGTDTFDNGSINILYE